MSQQIPQPAEEAFVMPDLPDEEAISMLYPQEEQTSERPEPSAPEPQRSVETLPQDAVAARVAQLEQALQNLPGLIAQGVQGGIQNRPGEAPRSALDQLKAENQGVDPTQLEWLAKTVRPMIIELVGPLHQELQLLKGATVSTVQERLREDFNAHMDRQMTIAGIDTADEFTREAIRARVIMDGQNTPGFTKDHATSLVRKYNGQRLGGSQVTQQYVDRKKQEEEDSPPVAHSSGATTAVQGIRKALTDPKNRKMGFRGQDFEKLVTTSLSAALGGKPTRK